MESGLDGEQKILEAVRAGGAKHATTTATAVRNAFGTLGVKKLLLITPYDPQTTEHEAVYLRAAGYEVAQQVARDLKGSDGYCAATPASWISTVQGVKRDDVDTYFLSCANINVMGIIEDLERDLNRPVITSNQVVIWDALRTAGSPAQPDRLGRLFKNPARV
jgi:maleate isomerase